MDDQQKAALQARLTADHTEPRHSVPLANVGVSGADHLPPISTSALPPPPGSVPGPGQRRPTTQHQGLAPIGVSARAQDRVAFMRPAAAADFPTAANARLASQAPPRPGDGIVAGLTAEEAVRSGAWGESRHEALALIRKAMVAKGLHDDKNEGVNFFTDWQTSQANVRQGLEARTRQVERRPATTTYPQARPTGSTPQLEMKLRAMGKLRHLPPQK